MKILKKILIAAMSLGLIINLVGCTSTPKKIIIGEGDWDSNALHDQIVKIIIEEGYGVPTDIIIVDSPVLISGLRTNDIDLSVEFWSDNILTYNDDISNGYYVELCTNFDDNMQGIYVPAYLVQGEDAIAPDLKTVKDLKNYSDLFPDPEGSDKGIIYGGPEGWLVTEFLHKKMIEYGLDEYYVFRTIDSSATLSATLSGAYEKGEPWVGYNWEPTWVMGLYDMVLLEDEEFSTDNFEKGIGSCPSVDVNVVATPKFIDEYPEIADFLSKYKTSSKLTSEGLAYMQKNGAEKEETAKWILNENKDLLKGWVSEDAYDKVIAYIQ
ncbi:MAG: glycine betaine ABC transporter substrate-binding protein [Clostridiaceae bacterium]